MDIIDLDYEPWHTAKDTLDAVSARSLQVVGDVVLAALPHIEARLTKGLTLTGRRLQPRRPYVLTAARHKIKKGHRHHRRLLNSDIAIARRTKQPLVPRCPIPSPNPLIPNPTNP